MRVTVTSSLQRHHDALVRADEHVPQIVRRLAEVRTPDDMLTR